MCDCLKQHGQYGKVISIIQGICISIRYKILLYVYIYIGTYTYICIYVYTHTHPKTSVLDLPPRRPYNPKSAHTREFPKLGTPNIVP